MTEHTAAAVTDPSLLTLRGPADLVAAVPLLLGFHPTDSIVVVSLCGPRRRIGLTLRADLADADNRGFFPYLVGHVVRDGARDALVAAYGRGPEPASGRPVVGSLIDELELVGVGVRDALYVGG